MSSTYHLVMKKGPNPGQVFELDGTEFTIGRDINNDFVINDSEMSRKHAKIYIYGQGFVVEDLGSTNGTFVNGQRLAGIHQLVSGDTVSFGENVSCSFEVPVFDPDATRVSAQAPVASAPFVQEKQPVGHPQETFISAPEPQQYVSAPEPQHYTSAPVQPSYSNDVPGAYPSAQKPKKNRTLLIIIIIFLLIICGCIVFWLVIDSLNLYCDLFPGIMNSLFGAGSCP